MDYFILIFIVGLSFSEGIDHIEQTVRDDPSDPLGMDEAYLIVHNMLPSDNITVRWNTIECEYCDLVRNMTADPNQTNSRTIDTKYAYDLEVQSSSSNISVSPSCNFKSYKFDENGTYVLHIMSNMSSSTYDCSIKQTGNLSNYMAPAIVGIVIFILYAIVVQIIQRLHQKQYFKCFGLKSEQRSQLINDTRDTIASDPTENITESTHESRRDVNVDMMSNPAALYDNKPRPKGRSSKRLHGLDTFRGFALMVMIFVNYGGKYSNLFERIC